MNRIYKLKFDKRRNELVIVSEITAGAGKEKSTGHIADLSALSPFRKLLGALTPVALLTGLITGLLPAMVLAADLPAGGQIVGGQGSISTSGNQMTIHQQTQNMATNWHSFDIGKNNTVQFVQPDSSSVALNRVTGASGSQIMGTLKANGQVFILNPNGVLFGKGARVNVGGLVASTKNISTADFMKGQYTLSGSGNPGAQVVNQGSLTTAKGGYIVLAGERVSNSGAVTTPSGKTVLVAGKTVTLQLDNGGLTSVSVNGSVVNALVENRGLISATDGQVYLTAKGQDMLLKTVVNNSGTVEAKGLASRGGEIVLNGGESGVVSQSGLLLADSQTGQGGKITLEGQNIHLEGRSLTSATGKAGGGEVYAGGGWQGKDSGIRNASKVVMDKAATVDVSATENGNGGTAVLWSEDYTNFRGTVLAKGGARSGNGGKVETSSHQNLQASGDVDASARAGRGGEWLLDPTDVNIVGTGSETGIDSAIADGTDIFTPTAAGAQILNTSIVSQLNAGTNVTIKTSGVDTDGKSGNITVNADIIKNAGTDATLTLLADNNIWTKDRVSMGASTGKLNLNLLAGNTTNNASVSLGQFINISLNGGDFLAGAANAENGISLTYRNNGKIQGGNVTLNVSRGLSGYAWNAMADNDLTVNGPVSASTGWDVTLGLSAGGKVAINSPGSISLQASETDNGGGHVLISGDKGVSLNAANGNINLKAADNSANHVNITSTSGDISMSARGTLGLTVTDISSTGGNIRLMSDNTGGTSFSFTKTNITSSGGAVTLSALSNTHGEGLLMSNSSVSAKNDISGNFSQRVEIKQGTLTSEDGNITIAQGISINNATGTNLLNTNVTAVNGTINLNGTSVSGVALNLNNVTLNATAATIKGDSSSSGTGFSLTNMSFAGALADLINVTLSSAGSAAGVVNTLDSSVVNDANRDNLLAKKIENMTTMDMGGQAIFDDSTKTDKGWKQDYTSSDTPNGGWIFNNTTVNASGDVDVKGAGFTNSTLTVTGGNLSLDNGVSAPLTGTSITANDGFVSVHSKAGNIDLTKGNISAKGDVDLRADKGGITITGANATSRAGILSSAGNISINTQDAPGNIGLVVNNVTFSADNNISIDAVAGLAGAQIRGANFTATKGHINLNGSASWGGFDYLNAEFGGVLLYGDLLFKAGTGTTINATHASHAATYSPPVPLVFEGVNMTFDGGAEIDACGSYAGIVLSASDMVRASKSQVFVKNGDVNINATLDGLAVSGPTGGWGASASGAIVFNNGYGVVSFDLDVDKGSNVTINADSSANKSDPFAAFAAATPEATAADSQSNGFVFSGGGNISVSAVSDSADAVNLRLFNNENLTGNLAITGTSETGVGVNFDKYLSTKVSNATITGNSVSGVGVQMTAKNGSADLNGNSVSGSTATGKGGVILSGSNVTITNGTLTGNATDGNGSGVSMAGGSGFVLNGANVSGHAVDGSGISVNGTLTVNNGTALEGHATGIGNGVTVSGDLATDSGDGVSITGTALSGDGIKVDGDTTLTNAVLDGRADSGNGVNIAGNLTADSATQVTGHAASGTGVSLGAALTGASVEGSSDTGTGVHLSDNAVVTEAVLNGVSTAGDGVAVTGNVTLDDTSAAALNASSTDGTGLKLADDANVSIQTVTRVTQEKTDADGNPVLDADGNPETETVTTQAPVTTPVTLTGTSEHGAGIATEGNVSISGIVLNGSTTADTGTGVSLGGNLTIEDDISGVTAGATGNGTALVVNNAGIHSDGYTDSGKDFVISASVSGNGTAIKTRGSSQLDEVVLNGEAKGGGAAVELGGQVSGANITGTSDSGTAVRVTDGADVDGSVVKGHSDSGTGLQVSGNVSLSNTGLSGTTQTGTGTAVTGSLTADNASQVTGSATQDGGAGVTLDGTVTGATVIGEATSGDAVRIADGSQLTGADIKGTSVTGTGIKTQGNVTLEGGTQLAGGSEQGAALDVSGTLNHDPDSSVTTTPDNTGIVIGHENIHEVIPVVPPAQEEGGTSQPDQNPGGVVDEPAVDNPSVPSEPVHEHDHSQSHDASLIRQAEVSSQRRGAVNAQVTQRSQPARDGFHSAGTPPVPVDGYTPAALPVDISLCDGNDCQSESLDAGKPVKGNVTPSGR
ncbi:filamentous hemagglutinin N-terminal domain-containing protein [Salmonella enterica]|nr:filamentous hemagglutinin N-terminal domain-containing protein [Salmonella enterica]